jgi:hypothetical protein
MSSFAQNTPAEAVMTAERRRRERFEAACAAMQGMLANRVHNPNRAVCAEQAARYADALLAELDKVKP